MNRILAALAFTILGCAPRTAQQPVKTPLVVVCQCDDPNSRLFETAVRDAIAASPRYYEVHPNREDKTSYYKLVLVAIDADPAPVVVSVVVLRGDLFMTSAVRVCGTSKLAWCASSVLSVADHAIQSQ